MCRGDTAHLQWMPGFRVQGTQAVLAALPEWHDWLSSRLWQQVFGACPGPGPRHRSCSMPAAELCKLQSRADF